MRTRELVALVLCLAAAPRAAHADAESDRLFKEGQRLLADGHIAEACDSFAASDEREEHVGTLLNLGDCREQNGQIATAWNTFLEAAKLAQKSPKERKRAEEARRRAGYLQPRLSFLTISVPEASDIDGLTVTLDGKPITREYWNQGMPIDGGTYVIEAGAPGHDPWRKQVTVAPESAKAIVDVPRFAPIADITVAVTPAKKPDPPPAPAKPQVAAAVDDTDRDDEATPHRALFSPLRYGAVGLGGAAIGGAAIGLLSGLAANREAADASSHCPSPCTDAHYNAEARTATHDALVTNLAFAGAAVAAAGAVTLWIVGRPALRDHVVLAPEVGAGRASLSLSLEF